MYHPIIVDGIQKKFQTILITNEIVVAFNRIAEILLNFATSNSY